MISRASRPLPIFLTAILCLTFAGGMLGPAGQRTLADGDGELGPAPVYTGQPLPPSEVAAAATGPTVNPASRSASAAFYTSQFLGAPTPAIGWTGNFATCQKGTTAATFRNAVLQRILYFRAMAGVPTDVTLSSTLNAKNQQAALMMGKANGLSHTPDATWPCYTADGASAATNSNLALGKNGWQAINLYVWDFGPSNAGVGHRRWLLYPQTTVFGTGDVPDGTGPINSSNTIWVLNNVFDPRPPTRDDFVAWPPPGYVPYQVVYPRWSFSYPGADFSEATVTVRSRGFGVPVVTEPLSPAPGSNSIIGEPTIVWRLNDQLSENGPTAVASDTRFRVKIANVVVNGIARTFSYDVIVFDPATPPPPNPDCSLNRTTGRVGSKVTITCAHFEPRETVDIFWDSSKSTSRASFLSSSTGAGSVSFTIPTTRNGDHRVIAKGRISRTQDVVHFDVLAGITLSPNSGEKGTTVTVKLTGFSSGESITIKWYNVAQTSSITLKQGLIASVLGTKTVTLTVPNAAVGSHRVRAIGNTGSYATTYFTLVAPAAASVPERTKTPTATPTPEPTPDATATSAPEATDVAPTETPTMAPAATETPAPAPTETATSEPEPTETPTPEPTATETPTAEPTPTEEPTATVEPTATPTETPVEESR